MALDATVGGPNANSYVTVSEAEAYFENRGDAAASWEDLENQEGYLITGSQVLDLYFSWKGTKTTYTQAKDWPRTGVTDKDDQAVPDDIIPLPVKTAVYELALYYSVEGDPFEAPLFAGLKEAQAASLTLKVDPNYGSGDKPTSPIPPFVRRILQGLLTSSYSRDNLIVVSDE